MGKSSANRTQKRRDGKEVVESEEIVKHMSNLPSFLERGQPIQDKALNFGVMDWGRLEQWQYHRQKMGFFVSNKDSPSSSSSSLLSSTDESSLRSSRGQSSSPALKPHHVTLQSHLNITPEGISTRRNLEKSQDVKDSRIKPRTCKMNDFDPENLPESLPSDDVGSFQTESSSSSSKGKMKIQDEGSFQDFNRSTIAARKHRSVSPPRRHRSSPLRKLLDPLFSSKPTSSTGQHIETFEDPKVKEKVKLDFGNCKEVKVGDSSRKNKMELSSSTKQALFQMAIKNGRPLFTFTVDNNNDNILAATVRTLNGKEESNSWIYTFFTIHEVKKKKGSWLFHGTKGTTGQGYLPNVTAQMRVSDLSVCREFVLSSLDPSLSDHQILDSQPQDELAAIVVQFLRTEENQDCFEMTIILPGGHHSVPSKGEPSPLIERWRSGGACDCGGWDMGCRLRTFTNKVESDRRSSGKFELFFEGDVISERPFFSLSQLKEGIFSVGYDSSLSLLHAFSICISVLECRKSSQNTELKTYVAKQVDDDDEPPITYASLPPVSPVERV